MLRLLATPRWLGRTLLALVLAAGCIGLGVWQWDRAQLTMDSEKAALETPLPVNELAPVGADLPGESVGRRVIVTGAYVDSPLYVSNRSLDGRKGFWVLSAVDLNDGTQAAVLRGWLPDVTKVPIGSVKVDGVLQPTEDFYSGSTSNDGVIAAMTHDEIVAAWGGDVRAGIVVLSSQEPALSGDPAPVPPTVQVGGVGFPLQNFFYALQWLIFGAFVVFMWWRWLRLDLRDLRREEEAA